MALRLLADPTRRRIVALIATGTGRPAAIAAAIGLSRPAMSRQLRLLVRGGLLRWTWSLLDLRGRLYVVDPRMEGPIIAWLTGVEIGRPAWQPARWSRPVDRGPHIARQRTAQSGESAPEVD